MVSTRGAAKRKLAEADVPEGEVTTPVKESPKPAAKKQARSAEKGSKSTTPKRRATSKSATPKKARGKGKKAETEEEAATENHHEEEGVQVDTTGQPSADAPPQEPTDDKDISPAGDAPEVAKEAEPEAAKEVEEKSGEAAEPAQEVVMQESKDEAAAEVGEDAHEEEQAGMDVDIPPQPTEAPVSEAVEDESVEDAAKEEKPGEGELVAEDVPKDEDTGKDAELQQGAGTVEADAKPQEEGAAEVETMKETPQVGMTDNAPELAVDGDADEKPADEKGTNDPIGEIAEGQDDHGDDAKVAGSGTPKAPTDAPPDTTLEEGHVYFLYRPRVTIAEVKSLDDVQRFHILLQPHRRGGETKCRMISIGKKRLPDITRHERFFGFVEALDDEVQGLTAGLGPETYETKTRGTRHQGGARLVGMGIYTIALKTSGRKHSSHLAYKLEVPRELGDAQKVLKIGMAGSYVISVKNPARSQPGRPTAGPDPGYSEAEMKQFQGRSWTSIEDIHLLDHHGTELLLVGADQDPVGELEGTGHHLEESFMADVLDLPSDSDAVVAELEDRVQPEATIDAPVLLGPAVTGQLE